MENIDLENERAAVAMLLAAAQAMQDAPPASAPEPVGDINDLHALFEKQKQIGNELTALKSREADLTRQLQSIRDEEVELERQQSLIKKRAADLFETLFGRPERPAPPRQIPQVATAEVSSSENLPPEVRQITRIPSLSL